MKKIFITCFSLLLFFPCQSYADPTLSMNRMVYYEKNIFDPMHFSINDNYLIRAASWITGLDDYNGTNYNPALASVTYSFNSETPKNLSFFPDYYPNNRTPPPPRQLYNRVLVQSSNPIDVNPYAGEYAFNASFPTESWDKIVSPVLSVSSNDLADLPDSATNVVFDPDTLTVSWGFTDNNPDFFRIRIFPIVNNAPDGAHMSDESPILNGNSRQYTFIPTGPVRPGSFAIRVDAMNWNQTEIGSTVASATRYWSEGTIPSPVPEPATMLLLGLGLVGITGLMRRFSNEAPS
jgi:hypothetical protein